MLDKPVFLICSERSGSNLIRVIMGSNNQFEAPMPMHLLQLIYRHIPLYGDLADDKNWHKLIEHITEILRNQVGKLEVEITEGQIKESVTERSFWGIFDHIYSKAVQGKRLFFKENHNYMFVPALLNKYPDSKFVVQVRDPRDFVLSMIQRSTEIHDIFRAIEVWRRDQERALELAKVLPERVIVHRYEDLISDPEKTLKRLCLFLNAEFEESMIEFNKKGSSKTAAGLSKSWENLEKGIIKNNEKKYLKGLSSKEIKIIEYTLSPLMNEFGYELDFPGKATFLTKFYSRFGQSPLRDILPKFLPKAKKVGLYPEEEKRRRDFKALRQRQRADLV